MLNGLGPLSMFALWAPSGRAITAMKNGRVHAAVVHGLEAILGSRIPIVQQDPAAASQQALERAWRSAGMTASAPGVRASGHLDAARRAQATGGAAVTMEAAARAFHLDFLPLEIHDVELWVDDQWVGHPGLVALGETLTTVAFTRRVAAFGGYDLAHCGERVDAA